MPNKSRFEVVRFKIKSSEPIKEPEKEHQFKITHFTIKPSTTEEIEEPEAEQCQILIPYSESKLFPIDDAIQKCMKYSQQTQTECGFLFDRDTNQLMSPILKGCENKIELGYKTIAIDERKKNHRYGDFHTHPSTKFELDDCFFSENDIHASLMQGNTQQIVGCITKHGDQKIIGVDYGTTDKKEIWNFFKEITRKQDMVEGMNSYADLEAYEHELKELKNKFLHRFPLKSKSSH